MVAVHRWKIEMLGGLRIVGERTIHDRFRTQKTGALLGFLAYHRGVEHSREQLADQLWPEDHRDAGRHKLSVALSALRSQLEPPGTPDGSILKTGRLNVSLCATEVATDVDELIQAWEQFRTLPPGAIPECPLRCVVAGYRGKLLPGSYEEWVYPEQERLQGIYFQAVHHLVDLLMQRGEYQAGLDAALASLRHDAAREETHRQIIRIHLKRGDVAAARKQFEVLASRLWNDLSVRPSRETLALLFPDSPDLQLQPALVAADRGSQVGPEIEPVGGVVPLASRFYIDRAADHDLSRSLERRDSIVLLKGTAQVGKSSLLARGLDQARREGSRAFRTDFRLLNEERLASASALLHSLADSLAEQSGLPQPRWDEWVSFGGPNLAFSRFLKQEVLRVSESPAVWGLDGVDRLFSYSFGTEVFELIRSWHNERAFDPDGPWSRLTVVIAYATEPHMFITDPNRSPFNVGIRLQLVDFTMEQVSTLNRRHGSPVKSTADLERLVAMVGGHPYLVRRGLRELASGATDLGRLEATAPRRDGPFGDHLVRIHELLGRDPELWRTTERVVAGEKSVGREEFFRLRSMGLMSGETERAVSFRCGLYRSYLENEMGR